jgi:hypothetical protein
LGNRGLREIAAAIGIGGIGRGFPSLVFGRSRLGKMLCHVSGIGTSQQPHRRVCFGCDTHDESRYLCGVALGICLQVFAVPRQYADRLSVLFTEGIDAHR